VVRPALATTVHVPRFIKKTQPFRISQKSELFETEIDTAAPILDVA
jgi:hypothetical protein